MLSVDRPSRMLAFVREIADGDPVGWILAEDGGAFGPEVQAGGYELVEHDVPVPEELGLLVFEGWLHIVDDECIWNGGWRRLTSWEMTRVRCGLPPWEAA